MTLDRPRVPPELVDHIVDFLHADRNTLCTLTVVSKSFLPTSSLHLFNSIAIDIGSKSLQDFDDFILHASPRVQCNLKKLMVTGTPEVVSIFGRTSKQKLEIPLLACVLSHIPLLSDLVIKSVTLEGIYTAPPVTPRRLNSLSIACVRASGGPVDICSLLALFSDIRTLHIEETTWAQIRPDPDAAVHQIDRIQTGYRNVFPCTKVTNLVMSTALYTRSFLEILRRTKTPVSLTYVEVMCSCMMDTWALGDFLGHTGQTVDMVLFNITRLFEGEIPGTSFCLPSFIVTFTHGLFPRQRSRTTSVNVSPYRPHVLLYGRLFCDCTSIWTAIASPLPCSQSSPALLNTLLRLSATLCSRWISPLRQLYTGLHSNAHSNEQSNTLSLSLWRPNGRCSTRSP